MLATWVVVADHEYAVIYTVPRGMSRLRRHRELHQPAIPVAAGADGGDDGSGVEAPVTSEQRSRAFAAFVALHVEDGYLARHFDELILAVAPDLLVPLRESLSEAVRAVIVAEIAGNLVSAPMATLQEQVLRVL